MKPGLLGAVFVALLAACGPGEEPPDRGDRPEVPPEGTAERAAWDVSRLLEGVVPGDTDAAEAALARLRAYGDTHRGRRGQIEALIAMARILTDLGRLEDAARVHLEAAESLPPADAAVARLEAVHALNAAGHHEASLGILEEMRTSATRGPAVRAVPVERARTLLLLKRDEEAFAAYREEAKRWGEAAPGRHVRLEMAVQLLERARDDEARAILEVLWSRYGTQPVGQVAGMRLAWLEARAGEGEAASSILVRIEKVGDPSLRGHAGALREGLKLLGEPAPPIAGPRLDGTALAPEALRGKTVVLVFWDSSSLPSFLEMSRWVNEALPEDIVVVGVASGRAEALRQALSRHEVEAPQRHPAEDLVRGLRIRQVPWTVVVDPSGRIAGVQWPAGRTADLPGSR